MDISFELTTEILFGALLIFGMRILGVAVATVRMLIMVQGQRRLSALLGFFESLIFVLAIAGVVTQLDNIWNVIAYAGGFAIGTYFGMWLEGRVVKNVYVTANIISATKSHDIADAIRAAGFGATEVWGRGAGGIVGTLRVVVRRQDVNQIVKISNDLDTDAFITLDDTVAVRHAFIAGRPVR